uniref:Uncharacterized protein n=1 Tax=Anopheles darlingi TaxID=43151 RepID=A0A2M4DR78_ANODA
MFFFLHFFLNSTSQYVVGLFLFFNFSLYVHCTCFSSCVITQCIHNTRFKQLPRQPNIPVPPDALMFVCTEFVCEF